MDEQDRQEQDQVGRQLIAELHAVVIRLGEAFPDEHGRAEALGPDTNPPRTVYEFIVHAKRILDAKNKEG